MPDPLRLNLQASGFAGGRWLESLYANSAGRSPIIKNTLACKSNKNIASKVYITRSDKAHAIEKTFFSKDNSKIITEDKLPNNDEKKGPYSNHNSLTDGK